MAMKCVHLYNESNIACLLSLAQENRDGARRVGNELLGDSRSQDERVARGEPTTVLGILDRDIVRLTLGARLRLDAVREDVVVQLTLPRYEWRSGDRNYGRDRAVLRC